MPGYFQSGIFVYTSDSLPSTVKPDTAVQALYLPVSHSVYEPAGGAAGSLFVCLDPWSARELTLSLMLFRGE